MSLLMDLGFDLKGFSEGPVIIDFIDEECRRIDQAAEEKEDEGGGTFEGTSQETDGLLSQRVGNKHGSGYEEDMISSKSFQERKKHYDELREKYTDPWRPETFGIFMSYFTVGISMYFVYASSLIYVVDTLNAGAVMTTVFTSIYTLPWSFKVCWGILMDSIPLFGYHRLAYMWLGWSIHVLANLVLGFLGTPTLTQVISMGFLMTSAMICADVAHDTLNVERSRLEDLKQRGYLQSRAYMLRGIGAVIGASIGAFAYGDSTTLSMGLSISGVYFVNALIPALLVFPFLPRLIEFNAGEKTIGLWERLITVKQTLDLRAVWEPMAFIYTFNVMMLSNPSWYNFEIKGLGFNSLDLGIINIGVAVSTFLGYLIYSFFLFNSSWRTVYVISICAGVFFSFSEIILESKWYQDWGIPPLLLAFGDTAFVQMSVALQLIPAAVMYVSLCPPGAEGTVYALLTTVANLGGACATVLSEFLVGIWDVDNETLAAGEWNGVLYLTILTKSLHFLPLLLIYNLPSSKEDQQKLKEAGEKSERNGTIFVCVLLASALFVIGTTIFEIAGDTSDDDAVDSTIEEEER